MTIYKIPKTVKEHESPIRSLIGCKVILLWFSSNSDGKTGSCVSPTDLIKRQHSYYSIGFESLNFLCLNNRMSRHKLFRLYLTRPDSRSVTVPTWCETSEMSSQTETGEEPSVGKGGRSVIEGLMRRYLYQERLVSNLSKIQEFLSALIWLVWT